MRAIIDDIQPAERGANGSERRLLSLLRSHASRITKEEEEKEEKEGEIDSRVSSEGLREHVGQNTASNYRAIHASGERVGAYRALSPFSPPA